MKWVVNIASNYLRFIASLLIMAVMTPYIIDSIGLNDYGLWILVYAAIGLINLSDMGFATAAVKFIAEQEGTHNYTRRNALLGSLLIAYMIIGLICAGLVVGLDAAQWIPGSTIDSDTVESGTVDPSNLFLLLGLTTAVCLVFSVFRAALIASGQQTALNLLSLIIMLVQAILTFVLLEQGAGIMGIALANCFGLLSQALVTLPLCVRLLPQFRPTITATWRTDLGSIAGFSCWAFIANGAFMLILRVDPFIVEAMLSLQAVALLGIALKIAEQILLFNKQFSNALMPLIAQQHGRGEQAGPAQLFTLGTKYLLAFAVPFTLLTAVSAESLIHAWVGPRMTAAAPTLMVLCAAVLLSTMQLNAANVLGMTGQAKYVALVMLASAVSKIFVTINIFPSVGIVGCAIGTLIGALLFECLGNLHKACQLTNQSLPSFFKQAIAPGLISCLPFVAISYQINLSSNHALSFPILLLVDGIAGLASLMIFYKFFVRPTERQWLMQLFKKPSEQSSSPPREKESTTCQLSASR
jgi:O-antigen/teichoic acid export membrane protein